MRTPHRPVGHRPIEATPGREAFAKLCNAYMDWCTVHNYSRHTVDHAYRYLGAFVDWIGGEGISNPADVTKATLERYQHWLFRHKTYHGAPIAFSTQKCYLSPVRSWFRWLAKNNHIRFNPASEIELPKPEQRLPKNILTLQEVNRVLAQPRTHEILGIRDRAILETFFSTGMRRLELGGLQLDDIDRERRTVHVQQGKGRKDRIIPLGSKALLWIDRYLLKSRPSLNRIDSPTKTLFLTHHGNDFTLYRLSQLVKGYLGTAKIEKKGSCHMFRHTMATLMLENGCDIRYIQAILGHASLKTTEIYTRVSITKLVEIHRRTHPSESDSKTRNKADP